MRFNFFRNLSLCLFIALSPAIAFAQSNNFTIQEVKFESQGDTLAGSMVMPKKPFAAVVIVHGSDPVKREIEFAKVLAKEGIAVLTYDKRGVGASGGVYVGPSVGTNNIDSTNLHLLSHDASAAINTLLPYVKNKKIPIGLIGFSQAGWIIPLAAEKNSDVKFMLIFSGPVITTLEQLRFQFYTNGDEKFWDAHTEADAREHIKNDPDKYQFAAIDPQDALSKLTIPGLWIFGGKDIQVPVNLSIEHLNQLKASGKDYEHHLFPALGHNTAFSESPQPLKKALHWIKTLRKKRKL
ncbi:alpha/beta hydrolase [Neolewinella lacunae]|uniref:Alpha/beta hydrolase n=1 Tax=Neolewinella lacunae TaxID=1517758 RepID=A0A923PJF7_9BACT|nr:alpha/beta hydrolase [Neolewinella lacunae]MBC6995190.1 alpha/beta hydrolase [Neolewinella lacunae]MDN3634140.1 alpha/beta hydrolase [Neolewinella lacunae]